MGGSQLCQCGALERLTESERFGRAFAVTLTRRLLEFGALTVMGTASLVDT